jgi:hypothetical protein
LRYRYAGVIAINPNTDRAEVVNSATGTVHINEDWDTPVVVQDPNGFDMTTLNTTVEGLFPDFYVEDQPVVGFLTSSGHRFYLRSSTPVPGPIGPPPLAVTVQDGNLMFDYEDGVTIPGPAMPRPEALANEEIASLIETDGSTTAQTLHGKFVKRGEVGISIYAFGAEGDGATDDTAAIVAAAVSGTTVFFPDGVYLINQTVNLSAGTVFKAHTGGPGAWIQAANTRTGTLDTHTRHIMLQGDGAGLDGIRFRNNHTAPLTTNGSAEGATIQVYGGSSTARVVGAFIRNCRVQGLTGITVKGVATSDTVIDHNWLVDSAGIQYTYFGPSRTNVIRNVIIRAVGNGLTGTASAELPASGCHLSENVVLSPGRMGVEGFGSLSGTIITGNVVRDTANIAMSLVGYKTHVSGNTVTNYQGYAIEATGAGAVIGGNHLGQESPERLHTGTGVAVNSLGSGALKPLGTVITGNVIESPKIGVWVGGAPKSVQVKSNTFYDPQSRAVLIEGTDTDLRFQAQNNTIRFASPLPASVVSRAGIDIYTGAAAGTQTYTIEGNFVVWEPTATFHSGAAEYIVKPGENNMRVRGNMFHVGGIKFGTNMDQTPYVGSPGTNKTGLEIIDNRFLGGATFNVTAFTDAVVRGNTEGIGAHIPLVVRAGATQGTKDFQVWRDNVGVDIARIGSDGSLHVLSNLGSVYAKNLRLRNSAGATAWTFTSNYGGGHNAFALQKGDSGARWLAIYPSGIGVSPAEAVCIQPNGVHAFTAGYSGTAPTLRFSDKATGPVVKPTVTGSRADGTAWASLLTALSTLGLVTDSTTA